MMKDTRFVVKFNSRRDATLFYNDAQKQLKKEHSHEGFTEYESVSHWKNEGGLLVTVFFKDPLTVKEAEKFSSFHSEWKLLYLQ